MNADGSDQRRLTADPAFERGPAWSPDGSDPHPVHPGGIQFVPGWPPHLVDDDKASQAMPSEL